MERMRRQFKFKANDSSLIFSGQSLDSRRLLATYNLEDGDTLTLVTKSKAIQVTVKHEGRPFIVETDEDETIGDLKKHCSEKVNQRPECLRLVGRGMTLFDDESLRNLPNTALHPVVEYRRQLQVVGLNGLRHQDDYPGDTQIW
jgi:hypothetical protein